MKVLVCGASGCVGRAVAQALRTRGHRVVEGTRQTGVAPSSLQIDYAQPTAPEVWAQHLGALHIDAIVNCVGILMPSRGQSFERVHTVGPIELFDGAALAGVKRVVQVSALGVDDSVDTLEIPYLRSKLLADEALAALPLEWAVVRPSLIYGPGSQSAALFGTLASLPLITLPGQGQQSVQPIHVFELAEAIAHLLEQTEPPQAVFELGGAHTLSYREMLSHYRAAMALAAPLWLPLPMALMRTGAWLAECLPQKVFCRDTIAMLARGNVAAHNAAPALLGREPSTLAHGLRISPPTSLINLQVQLSVQMSWLMRAALVFMWSYTALISLLQPQASGMLHLLARCGLEGRAATLAMLFSCTLNLGLAALSCWRHAPWVWALQFTAVVVYTLAAAWGMPELVIDHCGPLIKNIPVLALIGVLWLHAGSAAFSKRRGAIAAPCVNL